MRWSCTRVINCCLAVSVGVAVIFLMNSSGFRSVWSSLSFWPWSALDGHDSSSAEVLIFLGMCLMMKLYSWRSACHRTVHRFSFFGVL